jgi:hypothetical protein
MITRTAKREVITDVEGEVIRMRFDEDSLVHLMNQFIDLYKDKEMAVLREYSTNAWDSHVAAGNSNPIEITLPTTLSPTLVIRDHGVGLDWDDINRIYSRYGASTKRETDEQTGSLGLGCKSALSYTDQFTMQAIKDEILTVVSVSRDASGAGSMRLVEEDFAFGEPNGVTIVVPTKRHDNFASKAAKLFRFWPAGSVLVDGKAPEPFKGDLLVDGLYTYQGEESYVVMGNVPYPVEFEDFGLDDMGHYYRGLRLVAFVEMGSVDFMNTREALRETKRNEDALKEIGDNFREYMQAKAVADIDAAPDGAAALRRIRRWAKDLPSPLHPTAWQYRGKDVPRVFAYADTYAKSSAYGHREAWSMYVVPRKHYTLTQCSKLSEIPFETACDAIWFYGFDRSNFNPTDRRKLDQWYTQNAEKFSVEHFILINDEPQSPYLDKSRVFSWEDVKAQKIPRQVYTDGGRLVGSYDIAIPGRRNDTEQLQAADFDESLPIYYFVMKEPTNSKKRSYWGDVTRSMTAAPYVDLIRHYTPDCTVALMPPNREAKFLRTFPQAQELKAAVSQRWAWWLRSIRPDRKIALTMHERGAHHLLQQLDEERLADAALREAVRISKLDISHLQETIKRFKSVNLDFEFPEWENPLVHYPLARSNFSNLDHLYLYFDAAFRCFRLDPAGT